MRRRTNHIMALVLSVLADITIRLVGFLSVAFYNIIELDVDLACE
jgi:hypothetical protein